jgi:hypothetical protein
MRYALLIYTNPGSFESLSEEAREAESAKYFEIADLPNCVEGAHLQGVDLASTVRVPNGTPLVTDGPFADTKEVFAGYFVFEADNLDQVLEIAARVPATWRGGGVEVRPVVEH